MERPELYHGTDVRMIKMSEEERQHFFDACNLVIESIFPFYVPLLQFVKEKVKIGNACNKSVFLLRMLMTVGVCTINKRNLYSLSYLPAGTAVCTDAECCLL